MKNTIYLLLLLSFVLISFSNCESNAEPETPEIPEEPQVIKSNFIFEEVYTFEAGLFGGPHIGMIGSTSDNSLFISCRENNPNSNTTEEETIKLNLDTNQVTRKNSSPGGYITKQLRIVEDQLISIGGTQLKTFDLDLANASANTNYSTNYGFSLSKFGIAADNENTYVIGGYRIDTATRENKKIYKLNINSSELFEEVIDTPETMLGASGAVLNGKIYVFGGVVYENIEATNKIYIYPLDNPANYEELSMSVKADVTFVHKYGEIIFIAGYKGLYGGGEKTSFIAKFDINTNTFEEIEQNIDSEGGVKAIHQMIIKDDKMYILYGHEGIWPTLMSDWSVLVSDLY